MRQRHFGLGYGWLPLIAGIAWLVTIAWLLGLWLRDGSPQYKQDDADVVYISDVGAVHKRLFRIGACITGGFFVLALLADFCLRKQECLPGFRHFRARVDSIMALLFGIAAAACLILLTFFGADTHKGLHWALTLGFIVCLSISCLFTVAEYRRLKKAHNHKCLKRSYFLKLFIVSLAIGLTIAMIVLMFTCRNYWSATEPEGRCNRIHSVSAICEWVIALLFALYLLTMVRDLRPTLYTSPTTTATAMEAGYAHNANTIRPVAENTNNMSVHHQTYVVSDYPEGTVYPETGYPAQGYDNPSHGYYPAPNSAGIPHGSHPGHHYQSTKPHPSSGYY
ncbi:Frag1/DRAM/Sfk1 family-domain-containing protein [Gaertneriomyces semiglobifer]|nr:Frag1/DRAM/Sfk1 family-domain-containing protein [Gaertneriomyces semiglobifer]